MMEILEKQTGNSCVVLVGVTAVTRIAFVVI